MSKNCSPAGLSKLQLKLQRQRLPCGRKTEGKSKTERVPRQNAGQIIQLEMRVVLAIALETLDVFIIAHVDLHASVPTMSLYVFYTTVI